MWGCLFFYRWGEVCFLGGPGGRSWPGPVWWRCCCGVVGVVEWVKGRGGRFRSGVGGWQWGGGAVGVVELGGGRSFQASLRGGPFCGGRIRRRGEGVDHSGRGGGELGGSSVPPPVKGGTETLRSVCR